MQTVVGILSDADGLARTQVLEQGANGPRLRTRAWASPARDYADVQPSEIPIDYEHNSRPLGRIVYLERDTNADLWAVGHVSDFEPVVSVRVGDRSVPVRTDFFWSAERFGGEEMGGLHLRSVALVTGTARIHARPVTWLDGAMDHRHVADERWHLPPGHLRDLLERAAASHLDRYAALRQRTAWDGMRIHDRREAPPEVVRVRGGWLVDDELVTPQASGGYYDGERPHGPLRWRPSRITAVR